MDKTFVKGLKLIEILAASKDARGVTSLARETGFTKSNIHRLLTTLVACGYARRGEADGTYELSAKIWELGVAVGNRFDLVKVARAAMLALGERTGETVHLSVLDGYEVLYLDKIESRQAIAAYTRVGGRAPAWCVATGKAMLAHTLSDAGVLRPHLKRYTGTTLMKVGEIERDLAAIRMRGYAVNKGEWRADVFGIAAPIRNATQTVVGAIGISGPATRFRARQIRSWASFVLDAAGSVSRSLGAPAAPG